MGESDIASRGVTVTKRADDGPYEGTVRERHAFAVDEGERAPPVGTGEDRHPTPVDYLVASLASCQAAVLAQCLSKARVEAFEITVAAAVDERWTGEVPEEMPDSTTSPSRWT